MSPKAIAVAGLSAIAIAGSGCGGDSDEVKFRAAFKKSSVRHRGTTTSPGWRWRTGAVADIELTTDLGPGDGQADARTICGAVRTSLSTPARSTRFQPAR